MKIIVVGCGRVGSTLARLMHAADHQVMVVDLTSEAFRRLGAKYRGSRLVGNGTDEDVLKRAGIEGCDVFVAVTQGDNRNIMAAQIARELYGVKVVLTRINDPVRAHMYRSQGIVTLCGTTILSGLIADFITTGEWSVEKDYNSNYLENQL